MSDKPSALSDQDSPPATPTPPAVPECECGHSHHSIEDQYRHYPPPYPYYYPPYPYYPPPTDPHRVYYPHYHPDPYYPVKQHPYTPASPSEYYPPPAGNVVRPQALKGKKPGTPVRPPPTVVSSSSMGQGLAVSSRASPVPNQVYSFEASNPRQTFDLVYLGIYDEVVTNKRVDAMGGMIRVWNDAKKHLYYDCVCKKRKPIKNLKAMIAHTKRHSTEESDKGSFTCDQCGREFSHYLGLNSHQRVHREEVTSTSVPPPDPVTHHPAFRNI